VQRLVLVGPPESSAMRMVHGYMVHGPFQMARRSIHSSHLIESVPAELSRRQIPGHAPNRGEDSCFSITTMMIIIEPHPTRVSPGTPALGFRLSSLPPVLRV